jgi:Outer membrane protein beta-barrel domain
MHYLHWPKARCIVTVLTIGVILFSKNAVAQRQLHRVEHDDWLYYFGLTLGYNSSSLHQVKANRFLVDDSVLVVNPSANGGITLGLLATGRLNERFQIRANPQLIIGGAKYFSYTLGSVRTGESTTQRQILPATLISLPVSIKFNSDRIHNFRTYLLGGLRWDKDLSSNSAARNAEDMIKLSGSDFAAEVGIGFSFYLPFVTVSPEIKFSYGLKNLHLKDNALKYSSVLDRIQSRMISFSLHLED